MKQAVMAFGLLAIAIGAIVVMLASNFEVNKATMFERAVSDSLYKSLEDMCFFNPDMSYEQILNGYMTNLAINLNGTNKIKVDVITIDRNFGIMDTINELTYSDFFNNEKTITIRKTIIHNPEVQNDFCQVDFVVADAFKGALFVEIGTTVAQAIFEFGCEADWNLNGLDPDEPITDDLTIYAN